MNLEKQKEVESFLEKYPEFWNVENFFWDTKNAVEEICSADSIINQIEEEHSIRVVINDFDKSIILYNNNELEIWGISVWTYEDGDIFFDPHLVFELLEEYRWLWIGQKLLDLYEKSFWLPEEEYTNVPSMIKIYLKNWYIIAEKLVSWMNLSTEFTEEDEKKIDKILNDAKNWNEEEKLNYTIKLVREN